MTKYLLITRPNHDDTTFYLFEWAKRTITFAKQHDFTVFDLDGKKANRKTFDSYNAKNKVNLIIFNGHGDAVSVTGYNNETIVEVGVNEVALDGKIVYSISCGSAMELGPAALSNGAIAYLGYEDDFVFFIDNNRAATPLQDSLAAVFLNHSQTLTNTLIKGNSVGEAYDKAKEELRQTFQDSLTNDPSISRYLWWDYINFACHGDKAAKV